MFKNHKSDVMWQQDVEYLSVPLQILSLSFSVLHVQHVLVARIII